MGLGLEKLLQALRAGEMDWQRLHDRFGGSVCANLTAAKRLGYIETCGEATFRLTALGKERCPNRRDVMPKRTSKNQHSKKQNIEVRA